MGGPYTWDVTEPDEQETRRQGDDRLREIKNTLQAVFQDGPMGTFPTDATCTLGWPRIFVYQTLAELQANAVAAPYNRLGYVSDDGANSGLYREAAAGWTKLTG